MSEGKGGHVVQIVVALIGAAAVLLAAYITTRKDDPPSTSTPGMTSSPTTLGPSSAAVTPASSGSDPIQEPTGLIALKVEPEAAKPGDTVVISGSGYPPNTPVQLNWRVRTTTPGGEIRQLGTGNVGAQGTFRVGVTVHRDVCNGDSTIEGLSAHVTGGSPQANLEVRGASC